MTNEEEKKNDLLELEQFEVLDHAQKSASVLDFERQLKALVIGQNAAVEGITDVFQIYRGGLSAAGRPLATMLFLGPTGTGKTKTVESAAQVIFGKTGAVIKVDCGEFQHSHEIAKLKGSPPGYLGHRETSPMLTQDNLDKYHTAENKVTFLLFDEIEKASESLWNLLLGILDKATLSLGDNRVVDFSRTIVIMTSNLGAREMQEMLETKIGFSTAKPQTTPAPEKIDAIAIDAARKRFSPEFINRIDKIVVFQTLTEEAITAILELELDAVRQRILAKSEAKFSIEFTDDAKAFIRSQGIDKRYNARPLKRAVERCIILPMSSLLNNANFIDGDRLVVDLHPSRQSLLFKKRKAVPSLLEQMIEEILKSPATAS